MTTLRLANPAMILLSVAAVALLAVFAPGPFLHGGTAFAQELPTDDPPVNFRVVFYTHSFVSLVWGIPLDRGITGCVVQRYEHNGNEFVSSGSDHRIECPDDIEGLSGTWGDEVEPNTLYKYELMLTNSSGTAIIETSVTVRTEPEPGQGSTDATLSNLTLSGVDMDPSERAFSARFLPNTVSYVGSAANDVTETTVTPTVNHSGASYVIKLNGVTDADGVIPLAVGSNTITVEVTAEDGNTSRTYTVVVTRAPTVTDPVSTDATLSSLTLSGIDIGTFDAATTSYIGRVANNVTETTVTPTANHSEASYVIKVGGVVDDGVISLAVGSNTITVEVTAEDGNTSRIYIVTVTRASIDPPPSDTKSPTSTVTDPVSTDATLSSLTLSGIDIVTFDAATTSYIGRADNDVTETTVTPTVNHSGASYVIKLNGGIDDDGVIPLAVGSNTITVEVTAEDGNTSRIYIVTVTRASTDATLSSLTLSGIDIGTFDAATTSYIGRVANNVTETTVTPTVNHSEASYVIKVGGVVDDDGVIPLAVGSNTITVEVTAEDGNTSRIYIVTVTRASTAPPPSDTKSPTSTDSEPVSTDATLSSLTLSGIDIGTFDVAITSYVGRVANDVTETTVTPTINHSGASYVIKLNGVTDEDGRIPLAVGSNTITIEVTAEDRNTSRTYITTVTRASTAPLPATRSLRPPLSQTLSPLPPLPVTRSPRPPLSQTLSPLMPR